MASQDLTAQRRRPIDLVKSSARRPRAKAPTRRPLTFSSSMEGVCSAQVQAQNKHSRGQIKARPQFASGLCRQKADKRVRNVHKEVNAIPQGGECYDEQRTPSRSYRSTFGTGITRQGARIAAG